MPMFPPMYENRAIYASKNNENRETIQCLQNTVKTGTGCRIYNNPEEWRRCRYARGNLTERFLAEMAPLAQTVPAARG